MVASSTCWAVAARLNKRIHKSGSSHGQWTLIPPCVRELLNLLDLRMCMQMPSEM
jgi:hypothetical protein